MLCWSPPPLSSTTATTQQTQTFFTFSTEQKASKPKTNRSIATIAALQALEPLHNVRFDHLQTPSQLSVKHTHTHTHCENMLDIILFTKHPTLRNQGESSSLSLTETHKQTNHPACLPQHTHTPQTNKWLLKEAEKKKEKAVSSKYNQQVSHYQNLQSHWAPRCPCAYCVCLLRWVDAAQ